MAIDTAKKVKKITVDGAEMELAGGNGTSKLPQIIDRSVTEITANDLVGITTIRRSCFAYCVKLLKAEIPSTVTYIYNQAFQQCTSLNQITLFATTPPTLVNTNAIPSNVTTIYIPYGTLNAYQSATNWSTLSSKFVEMEA